MTSHLPQKGVTTLTPPVATPLYEPTPSYTENRMQYLECWTHCAFLNQSCLKTFHVLTLENKIDMDLSIKKSTSVVSSNRRQILQLNRFPLTKKILKVHLLVAWQLINLVLAPILILILTPLLPNLNKFDHKVKSC